MQTVFDPYGQNRVQRGGNGVTFDGPMGYSAAGAPIENHGSYSHCDNSFRPPPHIPTQVFMGGSRKGKKRPSRKNRKSRQSRQGQRNQRGGGCGCMGSAPMRGGGSGNGGYGVVLSNENGKVYDSLSVGACPPPQAGGSRRQVGGAAGDPVYSYPAGYSYGDKSFVEAGNGTAHYADPLPYGSIMTGGKRKKSRKSKKSRKCSKKSRKSSKSRKY